MVALNVGYRKLYDAVGCVLAGRQELEITLQLDATRSAAVRLGPTPRFGIWISRGDKYVLPESGAKWEIKHHGDARRSGYPRNFFLEIACFCMIDIQDDLHRRFHAKDQNAQNEVIRLAEQSRTELNADIEMIAGSIALKFHRQFVLETINEDFVVVRGEDDYVTSHETSAAESLDAVTLPDQGVGTLAHMLQHMGETSEDWQRLGSATLGWLLRAISERDNISKFVALFIPLEMVLAGYSSAAQEGPNDRAERVRALIGQYGGEDSVVLAEYFNRLVESQKPSLTSRFEILACKAQLDGWERDIQIFKRFNRMRNALLHRGKKDVSILVSGPTENETFSLEDLVERYVSYVLFGDAIVYPSRWRPSRRA